MVQVALDVDTGVDDALALLFAIRHPGIDVCAVSCVTGNVPVDQVVANTLTVLDVAGARAVPVARGAERPLLNPPPGGDSVHGRDGLADLGLRRSGRRPMTAPAADLLHRAIVERPEPITLVGLAPLTNLALLVRLHPDALDRVERFVLVGGRLRGQPVGTTHRGDFNVATDPEAAAIVMGCGVPITMYSLDVFPDVRVSRAEADHLARASDPATRLAGLLALHQVRRFGGEYGTIGDAGAVVSLVAPGGLTTGTQEIDVGRCGESRGQTVVRGPGGGVAVEVATAVDGAVYAHTFIDTLTRPP